MTTKFPMTPSGEQRLQDELNRLKHVERPRVIKAIAEARSHGDLKENAEYHAAREEQGFIEGRIQEVEGKLSHAHVIDVKKIENTGKVIFGATVKLLHSDNGEEQLYQIVGEDEADIADRKISITSPLARALIGKHEGDEVEVNTPKGVQLYEISSVLYV